MKKKERNLQQQLAIFKAMTKSKKKDSWRTLEVEISGDVFTYEIDLGKEGEHVMLYHNKQIIFVKPTINHYDGHEYWEVASWKRGELEKFIKDLKNHMDVCEIMKMENSPLTDIYFPNVMPKLSKRQKTAIELAYANRYYSYPRKITLEKLAKIAKVGVSTFQEHLRKAELKLLPAIIEYQMKSE
jgi:predicted DNA binding protein